MTIIEANPVKFYLTKFFFLVFALIQWLVAGILLIQFQSWNRNFLICLIFITLGLIFFYIFLIVNEKMKRVAIGKNKIVIIEGDRNSRFSWPEVKSLKVIPVFNLYKLKLRGKKKPIYFFPAKNIDPAFELMASDDIKTRKIAARKKKESKIK